MLILRVRPVVSSLRLSPTSLRGGIVAQCAASGRILSVPCARNYMTELNKQKIFWHSRRGMLELDLLLVPFAQEVFETLAPDQQQLYEKLLQEEDHDLWNWFLDITEPPQTKFKPLIAQILAHKAAQAQT